MVKMRRKGLTRRLLAPMRRAWRKGSLERMNLLSASVYAFCGMLASSVASNASRPPSSSMRAALRKPSISFCPQESRTFHFDRVRKSRMRPMSASVSREPSCTAMVSSPIKVRLSPARVAAIFSLVTSETTLPSLSSMMRSP